MGSPGYGRALDRERGYGGAMVGPDVRQSMLDDQSPVRTERTDPLSDPLLGTRLGHYEINFVLGKGAYGAVYKARDVMLGRYVAIKFLHAFLDKSHEAMFLQEAKAVAALGKHPAIVAIFEFSEYQGRKYFVLEFVGRTRGCCCGAPARPAGGYGAAYWQGGVRRPRLRPQAPHYPPGHQAREYPAEIEGKREAGRFWRGEAV